MQSHTSLRWQAIVANQPSGWVLGDQGDDPGTLILSDARLATSARAVAEAIHPFGVEAVEAGAHGLGMTPELLGDLARAKSLPAQRDDPGSRDPVTRSVVAAGEFADFSLLLYIDAELREEGIEMIAPHRRVGKSPRPRTGASSGATRGAGRSRGSSPGCTASGAW